MSALQDFDENIVDPIVTRGAGFLGSLNAGEKKLLRRLLFLLIEFPERGDDYGSAPQSRVELHKLGKPAKVDRLLDGLVKAGVLTSVDEAGTLALRYSALTRRWEWLQKELKERMSFRSLALSWAESGGSSGALLSWPATWRYRRYTNLNDWEQIFLNTSGRQGALMFFLGIVLVLAGALSILGVQGLYTKYYAPTQVASVTRKILDGNTPAAQKVENIFWLSANNQKIELPQVSFTGTERKSLSKLRAAGAIFKNSKLQGVDFTEAFLPGTVFSGSAIAQTSFQKAYLIRADFEAAEFCQDVDFTGADVYEASFKRAKFSDNNIPKFDQSAWWQAYGWGLDEIELLHRKYPRDRITESDKYKREIDLAEGRLKQASDPMSRALALNAKAWQLAIYGVVADGQAEAAIREALKIFPEEARNGGRDFRPQMEDTLGYILLQKQGNEPAAKMKNIEEARDLLLSAARLELGDVLFRYAVALHASGRIWWRDTLRNALIEKQYDPSHELYLLQDYFTEEDIKTGIKDMTRRGSRRYPQCPAHGQDAPKLDQRQ